MSGSSYANNGKPNSVNNDDRNAVNNGSRNTNNNNNSGGLVPLSNNNNNNSGGGASKYVPPHLRNRQGGGDRDDDRSSRGGYDRRDDGGDRRYGASNTNNRGGGYDRRDDRYGGGRDDRRDNRRTVDDRDDRRDHRDDRPRNGSGKDHSDNNHHTPSTTTKNKENEPKIINDDHHDGDDNHRDDDGKDRISDERDDRDYDRRDDRDDRRDDRIGGGNRWANDRDDRDRSYGGGRGGGYGRDDRREGGYGSGGFGGRSGGGRFDMSSGPRNWRPPTADAVNRRDTRLEQELFGERMNTGINFKNYDDIPVEVSGEDVPKPIESFKDFSAIHEVLKGNVDLAGYDHPTPVQRHAIPIAMDRRDIMACAQTGSGKTASFLFPLIGLLLKGELYKLRPPADNRRSRRCCYPVALILSPTRELSQQIHQECRKFVYRTGLRPVVVYGGANIRDQMREIERGCDILVATPGRLVDFIERGLMSLSCIEYLVFDEADRMLDMGFEPQIRQIVEQCDMPIQERQTLMFSATFPKEIQRLAQDFLKNYVFLAVGRVGSTADFIVQKLEYGGDGERSKQDKLMHLLSKCEGLTLIFVETKRGADQLEHLLVQDGVDATSIHGDRTQGERETALAYFKSGRCPVLVATDVASRGLDIPNVQAVINYDLPNNIEDYVHRIGRTGRAGNTGTAISFVSEKNRSILRDLYELMKEANQEIPTWFEQMVKAGGFGGGYGGRGRGGGSYGGGARGGYGGGRGGGGFSNHGAFGGRDVRKDNQSWDNRPSSAASTSGSSSSAGAPTSSAASRVGGLVSTNSSSSSNRNYNSSRGGASGRTAYNDSW